MAEVSKQVKKDLQDGLRHLSNIASQLGELDEGTRADPNVERAEAIIAYAQSLAGRLDPKVTPVAASTEFQKHANTLATTASQLAGSETDSLRKQADTLLQALPVLGARLDDPLENQMKAAALRYKQSLDPRIRGLRNQLADVESQLAELEGTLDKKHQDHADTVDTQVREAAEQLQKLESDIASTKSRVDELISDQDKKFTAAQEDRRKEFGELTARASQELAVSQSEFEERRKKAEERLSEIEESISQTAAALGGEAVAFSHSHESRKQARVSFWWSMAALALGLTAAIIPIATGVLDRDQSVQSLIGKLAIGVIILAAARYAGGLARHHRERSARARRLEIELAAFDPFIAPLDGKERNKLRSEILWRFFGADAIDGDERVRTPSREIRERLRKGKEEDKGISE